MIKTLQQGAESYSRTERVFRGERPGNSGPLGDRTLPGAGINPP